MTHDCHTGGRNGSARPDDFGGLPTTWGAPHRPTSPFPAQTAWTTVRPPAMAGARRPSWRPCTMALDSEVRDTEAAATDAAEEGATAEPAPTVSAARSRDTRSRYVRWCALHPVAGVIMHLYAALLAAWLVVDLTALNHSRPIQAATTMLLDGVAWAVGHPAVGLPGGVLLALVLVFGHTRLLAAAGGFNRCRSCQRRISLLTFLSICDRCARSQEEELARATARMDESFQRLRVLSS
jgi:hypothetical protein